MSPWCSRTARDLPQAAPWQMGRGGEAGDAPQRQTGPAPARGQGKGDGFWDPALLNGVWEAGLRTRCAVTPAAGTRSRAATRGRPPRSPSRCAGPVPWLLPFKIKRQRAATPPRSRGCAASACLGLTCPCSRPWAPQALPPPHGLVSTGSRAAAGGRNKTLGEGRATRRGGKTKSPRTEGAGRLRRHGQRVQGGSTCKYSPKAHVGPSKTAADLSPSGERCPAPGALRAPGKGGGSNGAGQPGDGEGTCRVLLVCSPAMCNWPQTCKSGNPVRAGGAGSSGSSAGPIPREPGPRTLPPAGDPAAPSKTLKRHNANSFALWPPRRCHGAVAENKQNSPHVFPAPSTRCPSALLTRQGCARRGASCPRWGELPPVRCCPPALPRERPVPHPARTPPDATSLGASHGAGKRARLAESFLLKKLWAATRAGEKLPERKKPPVWERTWDGTRRQQRAVLGAAQSHKPQGILTGRCGASTGQEPSSEHGLHGPAWPFPAADRSKRNLSVERRPQPGEAHGESPRGRRCSLCFSVEVFGKGISQLPPWDLFALLNTHLTLTGN